MVRPWRPERGDLVWVSFDPIQGHEQKGRRPALVLSHGEYNEKTGLVLACPVTNVRKGFSFEVPLPDVLEIQGVILSDHVRSLDWQARRAEFISRAPLALLNEVLENIDILIKLPK